MHLKKNAEMFLSHCYIILAVSCMVQCQHIFSGMDVFDQIEEAEITAGGDVQYSESPYVAAVFNALVKHQTCTGVIIRPSFVLAGGYCVIQGDKAVDPMFVSVLSGVVDFRDREMDQWRYATSISKLPYKSKGRHVLVLIKLNEPFFENFSCGVTHFKRHKFGESALCMAISWRFHDKLDRLTLKSLVLKKSHGFVINKTECLNTYKYNPVLSGLDHLEFVCVNFPTPRKEENFDCMGADGSCVICEENGLDYPVGIAVNYYGESRCNRYQVPNVFLDIGAYSQWIDKVLNQNFG